MKSVTTKTKTKTKIMKRKDYLRQWAIVFILFTAFGFASMLSNEGMSNFWKIAIPTFFFTSNVIILVRGLVKYKD